MIENGFFFLVFSLFAFASPQISWDTDLYFERLQILLQEMADGGCVLVLGVLGTAIEQLGEMVCLSIFMSLEVAPKH